MEKFNTITSRVIPLAQKDVDTDLIIPAEFLTSIDRDGYAKNLFRRLRDADPNFVMNQPVYQGAQILLADDNFGCGSSREHAVWALLGAGIKVVISSSFADIFSGNSAKNGLLLITLPSEVIEKLLKNAEGGRLELTVDLENQSISAKGNLTWKFDFDPFRKHCLLTGQEDLDYLLEHSVKIDAFRQKQQSKLFYSTLQGNNDQA